MGQGSLGSQPKITLLLCFSYALFVLTHSSRTGFGGCLLRPINDTVDFAVAGAYD
jgi:hypothetical protein